MRKPDLRKLIWLVTTGILLSCFGCRPVADFESSELSAGAGETVLPLREGFYVAADIPCGAASNATLLRLHRDSLNGSRDVCSFLTIEQTGANRFLVIEQCNNLSTLEPTDAEPAETQTVEYLIINENHFSAITSNGWRREARYCDQASLPEPWRD